MAEIRTLIAEDNADIRHLVQLVLDATDDFMVCGIAHDGAQAVELALADQPDLVLLDVLMPKMTGIDALPLIRDAAPEAKVIFLTVLDAYLIDSLTPRPTPPDGYISKAHFVTRPRSALAELRRIVGR